MRSMKWALILLSIVLAGCETTTKTTNRFETQDGIDVQAKKADPIAAAKIRLALGLKYIRSGYMERAKSNLIKAETHAPEMADVLFGLAYYYQKVFEFDKSEGYYKKALNKSPKNPDFLNAYGAFLCKARKDYPGAEEYFLKAIDQPEYTSVGPTYENLGFCTLDGGNFSAAEQYFEKALTYDPDLSNSLQGLARVFLEKGNYNRAEAYILRFEGKNKPTAESLFLGYKIGRRLNDKSSMKSYGEKLMQLFPESEQASTYLRMRS